MSATGTAAVLVASATSAGRRERRRRRARKTRPPATPRAVGPAVPFAQNVGSDGTSKDDAPLAGNTLEAAGTDGSPAGAWRQRPGAGRGRQVRVLEDRDRALLEVDVHPHERRDAGDECSRDQRAGGRGMLGTFTVVRSRNMVGLHGVVATFATCHRARRRGCVNSTEGE
jgi:hypothetical protein